MLFAIVAFVVPLGFDTLAVAIALGVRGVPPLGPALAFALFEGLMPVAGLVIGRAVGDRFASAAAIAGGLILIGVAVFVLRETLEGDEETEHLSFASLRTAAAAGLGVSMDELAVGFSMGAARLPIAPTLLAIALQAFVVTVAGIAAGRAIGAASGRRGSRLAGILATAAFAALGLYLIARQLLPGLPEL